MSHPTAEQLLASVALFLKEAEAALPPRLSFHAKVAANSLAIVIREAWLAPDAAEAQALAPWGGAEATCMALRESALNPSDPALLAAIRTAALARLAVDNPRYATFQRLAERPIA